MRARVDTSKSVLTKLLAHSLGGNAYTLLIGAFAQGEPAESEALLKHMQVHNPPPPVLLCSNSGALCCKCMLMQDANLVETFPVKNGTCARGLLRSLQSHIFQLEAAQRALEEQLEGGSSHAPGISTVKMTQIMEQNLELKEEVAAVLQEKARVQGMLDSVQNSGARNSL